MDYKIYMDASADLDRKYIKAGEVSVLTMGYSRGDDMLTSQGLETVEDIKAFYEGQRHGDVTQTTQITPSGYEEAFEELVTNGTGVLYISLSSGLSSTYSSALLAKKNIEERCGREVPLYIIDSLSATGGIGVMLERALFNKKHGMSLEDNYKDVLEMSGKIKIWFYVDSLEYLKNGGRISPLTSVVGTVLGMKPILRVLPNGKLTNIDKRRGKLQAAERLSALYKGELERVKESYPDILEKDKQKLIYITHADDIKAAEHVKGLLEKVNPHAKIKISTMSPIIGAHTGPGAVIIAHLGGPEV